MTAAGRSQDGRSGRGFTLMEVLVAATGTLLLAGLLLALGSNVLSAWNRASGALTTANQAEVIMDQLTQDLESAVIRHDSRAWFVATVQRDQSGAGDAGMTDADWPAAAKPRGSASLLLVPAAGRIADARFGQAGVWLRLFAAQPDANDSPSNRSVPRAVAYQLIRRRVGTSSAYQFFRSQVRPGGSNSTFSVGYDLFAAGYTSPSGIEQNPGNVRRPNVHFLLGNNVIDFGLRVYVRNADGTLGLAFPVTNAASQSIVASTDPGAGAPGYAGQPVALAFPEVVEVMVRLLTPEGALLIGNLEAGLTPLPEGVAFDDHWWRIAEANSHVYVRRIQIKGQPL